MKRGQRWTGLFGLALTPGLALAFVLTTGRPSENVSGAGARAPGVLVGAGVARNDARTTDFSSVKDITQVTQPPGFVDMFLPQWIDAIFSEFNSALDLLINGLFLRAGETPPALSQLSNTPTPTRNAKQTARRSLTDRSLDRLDRNMR